MTLSVPVIDISLWDTDDDAARDEIAALVDEACRTVGFMQITGHGVSDDVVTGLTRAVDELFALDEHLKMQLRPPHPSVNRGYTPPKSERLSYSIGVDSPADMFEAFNVGVPVAASAADDLNMHSDNIWPDATSVPTFRANVETWLEAAGLLANRMTSIFAHALGLEVGFFKSFTDQSIELLRLNNYAIPEGTDLEGGQLGMGAHTDYGIVTILWADSVPGLEILDADGGWHPVAPLEGALLINLGDLLSRWTNDRYRSTMHRVVPPVDATGRSVRRRSAAFFHDGNADAMISTLATCRDEDGGSPYDDVTVAEHLSQKLGGSRGLQLNQHADREAARLGSQPRQ